MLPSLPQGLKPFDHDYNSGSMEHTLDMHHFSYNAPCKNFFMRLDTSQHLTAPHNTSQHLTTPHNTSQHLTTPHNTSQHLAESRKPSQN